MDLKVIGSNIEVTPALHEYVQTKCHRIARHVETVMTITVTLSTDKIAHKAHANIHIAGKSIHGEAIHKDMYAAIDILTEKLNRAALKHKEKLMSEMHHIEKP